MKIAYHFNADEESFGSDYGTPILKTLLKHINYCNLNIYSKIFVGDLLLHHLAMDIITEDNTQTHIFNSEKYIELVETWLKNNESRLMLLKEDIIHASFNNNIYTICFENISRKNAQTLHSQLNKYRWYLGAMEVDDTSPVHWEVYSNSLIFLLKISNNQMGIYYTPDTDDRNIFLVNLINKCGFHAKLVSTNYRYSIVDKYHNYQHSKRIAEWKSAMGDHLAFIADDVVNKLSDPAPDLGNRLYSMLRTFENAEVDEDYSLVMTSCRRIIEYVADSIFPPDENAPDGKLGKKKYRNRLLAFADKERASDTNIDLICSSTSLLSEQLEKLSKLASKGVHSEVTKDEARRCIIRTILLLDDILSLKKGDFEIETVIDEGILDDIFN